MASVIQILSFSSLFKLGVISLEFFFTKWNVVFDFPSSISANITVRSEENRSQSELCKTKRSTMYELQL